MVIFSYFNHRLIRLKLLFFLTSGSLHIMNVFRIRPCVCLVLHISWDCYFLILMNPIVVPFVRINVLQKGFIYTDFFPFIISGIFNIFMRIPSAYNIIINIILNDECDKNKFCPRSDVTSLSGLLYLTNHDGT